MTQEQFMSLLLERLQTTNINQVKADVEHFVLNRQELDIWSNDYFVQVAHLIQIIAKE